MLQNTLRSIVQIKVLITTIFIFIFILSSLLTWLNNLEIQSLNAPKYLLPYYIIPVQVQREHEVIMPGMLSDHFIDSSSALLQQQSLILPAPNHLEWEFCCVYNIWVCMALQSSGGKSCSDTALLILLSSFISIYSLLQKSHKYCTQHWLTFNLCVLN